MQPRDGGLQAVRRALAYLRRYRREAVGAVVALLLVAAANLATPQLIRVAIDVGFTQAQPSVLAEAVAGLVALALVRGLFTFLQGYLAAGGGGVPVLGAEFLESEHVLLDRIAFLVDSSVFSVARHPHKPCPTSDP